jgi:prevent-host-death family protein
MEVVPTEWRVFMDVKKYTLDVDLKQGVVPISKAASSLAALIKRSRANHQPIIVTQKGYPTGVILDVELFTALRELADQQIAESDDEGATADS